MTATEIKIDSSAARMIAADMAEERGDMALANALRDLQRPLTLANGKLTSGWRSSYELKEAPAELVKVSKALGNRKRSIGLMVSERVLLSGRYWDGGSKSEYAPFNLNSMSRLSAFPSINPMRGDHEEEQPTAPGTGIVEGGTFCGKPTTPCLHIHPDDAPRFGLEYIPAFE